MFPVQINAVEKMGVVTSIITSVIVLVIALVIFEFLFNPYAFSSIRASLTHTVSGLANNAQTVAIKAAASVQSNKPVLYIAENSNNTVALFDTQYNKIIGYINLSGESPNNLEIGPNNMIYVTGSYYNYHNPQYHGIISVINDSNDKVIGAISMASVPTRIALSANGTYAYTINSNNTESSINLQKMIVTASFPFTSGGGVTEGQNATAYCRYTNMGPNTTISCRGLSGLSQPVTNWTVAIYNQSTLITRTLVFQKNYTTQSFSGNYTLPPISPSYAGPDYTTYVNAYNDSSKLVTFTFLESSQQASQNIIGIPEGLVYSPKANLLFVLVNYAGICQSGNMGFGGFTNQCSIQTLFALNGSNVNQTIWQIVLTPHNISSSGPKQLVISPDGKALYAMLGSNGDGTTTLAIINTTSEKEAKSIDFGVGDQGGTSISMSPVGDYVYVVYSGLEGGGIAVINTSSQSVVDSINAASGVGESLSDVVVGFNATYVIKNAPLGPEGYYLMIIARANDSIINSVGLNGCPCEVELP